MVLGRKCKKAGRHSILHCTHVARPLKKIAKEFGQPTAVLLAETARALYSNTSSCLLLFERSGVSLHILSQAACSSCLWVFESSSANDPKFLAEVTCLPTSHPILLHRTVFFGSFPSYLWRSHVIRSDLRFSGKKR